MTADREALRERVARAMWERYAPHIPWDDTENKVIRDVWMKHADAAIAVVLEEAARVAEEMTPRPPQGVPPDWPLPIEIAAAIRALINKEAT